MARPPLPFIRDHPELKPTLERPQKALSPHYPLELYAFYNILESQTLEDLQVMSMFSPPRREKARADDSHLPQGDCRYILLHPEVKGRRCACVGFALNRSIPGSTCDCGHQACYHENGTVERQELEALRKKVDMLEEQLERERQGGANGGMIDRIGRLEDLVDRTKAESDADHKDIYRGIQGLWQNMETLNKRTPYYDDDRLERLVDDVERIRNRLIEIDDASMHMEDRVDAMEKSTKYSMPVISRRRKASTPPSPGGEDSTDSSMHSSRTETPFHLGARLPYGLEMSDEARSFRERVSSVGSGSHAWTVHVSLLPTASQPFPFEKDTAAYQRCLSRGKLFHQLFKFTWNLSCPEHSTQTLIQY